MHHLAVLAQSHHTSDGASIKGSWLTGNITDLTEEQLKQVVTGRIGDFLYLNLEFIAYELIEIT